MLENLCQATSVSLQRAQNDSKRWLWCGVLRWCFQEKWWMRQTIQQILCCIPKLLYLKGKMHTGTDKCSPRHFS